MVNDYAGQPVEGENLASLMRRVNGLEASVAAVWVRNFGSDTFLHIGGDATHVFLGEGSDVHKYTNEGVFVDSWGGLGVGDGEFHNVREISADPDDDSYLYVVDGSNIVDTVHHRVQYFLKDGTFVGKWGSYGFGNGQFTNPLALTVLDSEVYVGEVFFGDRVQVFNTTGGYLRQWSPGFDIGSLHGFNGEIYAASRENHEVVVYNTTGTVQRRWGSLGTGNGQFNSPRGIIELGGKIYVADTGTLISSNNRVQIFKPDGTFLQKFGSAGIGNGQFDRPTSIATSSGTGDLYVTDAGNTRAQQFSLPEQTAFDGYKIGQAPVSLGTPDGGVSVPSDDALFDGDYDMVPDHIHDMRTAIEALAPSYINSGTGNAFNFTDLSADNLYFVAMGDRTKYGATGGAEYDWTTADLDGSPIEDINIGELLECIVVLEASALAL